MTDDRYLKRTIVKEEVQSSYLNETRNLRVYLPPGYQEWLSYPVVYCQDGEDFFNFGRVATHANQIILDDDIEPFIIVGVEVDKRIRTSEYSPSGERHENYVQFFAHELIPYIEGKYPVRNDADSRILAGDSLGGSVSLHIALRFPSLFKKVISLSGAFYPDSQSIIALQPDLSWLEIWMLVGLQETSFETDHGTFDFVAYNRATRDLFIEKHAKIQYDERDGYHLWGFWQQHIPEALKYFLQ
ncbi:enterochelin esterase [Paenibacillus selenitireducens]|uniref:Enterochelin esterase n=1 Tax=Paenibacillus selenitireducens TaxID=1324314 RepID=A0A1T2X411_9BACL|nr:alpha/beta hydrolase-fold protein [Paenibacillus selenitireducens]OPA74641.1 enterochelin esterase [Paenibacillus selenitireducens]